jgi:DNA-binding response OmpR family regulator
MIKIFFEEEGYDVTEAIDGKEGLTQIREQQPDLVICDISMPQMEGDEVFRIIRAEKSNFDVLPFIFLSGHIGENEIIDHLKDGADGCFAKPIRLPLLSAHVDASLARSKRYGNYFKRHLDIIADNKSISMYLPSVQH